MRDRGVLFWVVVFPILFYGLMIAIWGSPSTPTINLGGVNLDSGATLENGTHISLGGRLVETLEDTGVYRVKHYESVEALDSALRNGDIDIGLVVPENFTRSILSMNTSRVTIVVLETQWSDYYTEILASMVKGFSDGVRRRTIEASLQYIEGSVPEGTFSFVERFYRFIIEPVNVTVEREKPPLLGTIGGVRAYYALSMLGVEVLFIGLSIGVFAIIDKKRDGTLKILLASPMRSWELFLAETLSGLLAVAASAIAIILFSLLVGAEYHITAATAATVALLVALSALFTIGFGLLLAPLARSPEAAMALANGIAFPVMFVGGIIVPPFILPEPMQRFASVYPVSRLIEAVRQLLVYEKTPGWALSHSLPAIIGTIVVYALGFIVYSRLLARAVEE